MSDTTSTRPRGAAWIAWVAALLGFAFQVIWFSSQFGSVSARVEGNERRISFIEQNGSPAVQGIRTEVTINSRRLTSLEDLYTAKVGSLLTEVAAQAERLSLIRSELESLRQWRITHVHEDGVVDGRIFALDRQLQQMQAENIRLMHEVAVVSATKHSP